MNVFYIYDADDTRFTAIFRDNLSKPASERIRRMPLSESRAC